VVLPGKDNSNRKIIYRGQALRNGWLAKSFVLLMISAAILLFGPISASSTASPDRAGKKVNQDLFSVSFVTEKKGWTCGRWGTILHSDDGGKTWRQQNSTTDYTLSSIRFIDLNHGWAVGNGGTILHTQNGGKTWEKQKSPISTFLMGVHFADGRKGWAVGERTHILHTADGGKTWKVQFKDEDYILKSISFCDGRNGWAAGEYGLIYHTADGGATWSKQAGGLSFSEETGDLIAGNILFDVVAINPKEAWVVGIDGYVAKTTDGGITWQQVKKGIPKVHLFGVARSEGKIVTVGNAYVLISGDDGSTFRAAQADPETTYGYLYAVSPRCKAGFVAVGKGGWIYLADNKALVWRLTKQR
jgi:photosystem II stability/assembly factor-like uncharacterized protein